MSVVVPSSGWQGWWRRATQLKVGRSEPITGFGHKIYPHEDSRPLLLMNAAQRVGSENPEAQLLADLVDAVEKAGHHPSTLALGLAIMTLVLEIPSPKSSSLFLIARLAGGRMSAVRVEPMQLYQQRLIDNRL
ncbi:MAG: citrate/2-methylcitrate synthase [Planctomycetales bacterium]|jgi:citrate synthase